jgi:hypothetical protein
LDSAKIVIKNGRAGIFGLCQNCDEKWPGRFFRNQKQNKHLWVLPFWTLKIR